MRKSGRFWLVFAAFVIVTLIGLLVPVGGYPAGLLILLVGAVAAVALKRRDPVLAAGLTWGVIAYLAAFGVLFLWGITHLQFP